MVLASRLGPVTYATPPGGAFMLGLSRMSSRRDRLRGLPFVIIARACALSGATAPGFSCSSLSIRAGGWGRLFSFQGACGLRPPCVAYCVPSCAWHLFGLPCGLLSGLAGLASGPWACRLDVRCSRLQLHHTSVFPICQALFAKIFSVFPVIPLRGIKNFYERGRRPFKAKTSPAE